MIPSAVVATTALFTVSRGALADRHQPDGRTITEFIQYVLDAIGSASATAARRSQRPSKTDICNPVDTETWGS